MRKLLGIVILFFALWFSMLLGSSANQAEAIQATGCIQSITKETVVLVSNNTDNKRGQVFLTYDNVESIPNAKKPVFSKAKIMKALKKEGLKKENAIFIGDQIFTDVIAARFCGIRTLLVDPLGASLIPLFEIKRFFEKPIKKRYVNKYGKNL